MQKHLHNRTADQCVHSVLMVVMAQAKAENLESPVASQAPKERQQSCCFWKTIECKGETAQAKVALHELQNSGQTEELRSVRDMVSFTPACRMLRSECDRRRIVKAAEHATEISRRHL